MLLLSTSAITTEFKIRNGKCMAEMIGHFLYYSSLYSVVKYSLNMDNCFCKFSVCGFHPHFNCVTLIYN